MSSNLVPSDAAKQKKRDAISAWLTDLLQIHVGQVHVAVASSSSRVSLHGSERSILIPCNSVFWDSSEAGLPCVEWDPLIEGFAVPLNQPLPAPGLSSLPFPLVQQQEADCVIRYDLLGLAYWMLARVEEVGRTDLDDHGRFPSTASHGYRFRYLHRPLVDEWMSILFQVAARVWPQLPPLKRRFSIQVSHDVDSPSRYCFASGRQLVRAIAADILKYRDFSSAIRAPYSRLRKRMHSSDRSNTFDWIMNVSERHSLKSAFYFICGRTDPVRDADYNPDDPVIRSLIRRIANRGHEVGLHPSYGTYLNPAAIAAEAETLRRICAQEGIDQKEWGGRMHFLRWKTPTTLLGWVLAGMDYDSTLAYADYPGFRAGTCFEYQAIDPVSGETLPLRIRPLIVMESTVIADRFMGLGTGEAAYNKFMELKNVCRRMDGRFTLLWHNSELATCEKRDL